MKFFSCYFLIILIHYINLLCSTNFWAKFISLKWGTRCVKNWKLICGFERISRHLLSENAFFVSNILYKAMYLNLSTSCESLRCQKQESSYRFEESSQNYRKYFSPNMQIFWTFPTSLNTQATELIHWYIVINCNK